MLPVYFLHICFTEERPIPWFSVSFFVVVKDISFSFCAAEAELPGSAFFAEVPELPDFSFEVAKTELPGSALDAAEPELPDFAFADADIALPLSDV